MLEPRRTSLLLAALGNAIMLPAVLIGAAATLRVPSLIAAGFPSQKFTNTVADLFGFPAWPGFLQTVGIAIASVMLVVSAVLLIIARRDAGAAHASRATLGIIGLFCAGYACFLATTPLNWINIIGQPQSMQKLSEAVQSVDSGKSLAAAIALFAGLVLLAWPERRRMIANQEMTVD
jgi:hypothetical protein